MNKQQLASKIWESANKMRSKIEANEYKDYILGFIFYKFLSDKEEKYLKNLGYTDEDLPTVSEDDPDIVENVQNNIGYFIAYKDLFSTWLAKGSDFGVADVMDALSAFNRLISSTHKKVFEKIFDTLQTGLSKLGDGAASQTRAIKDLIHLIKNIPMDGKQDYDVLGFIYEYLISNFAANAGKKAGEFYTPHEVSLLMSEIVADHLRGREEIKIYDPTSGSGSLLINIGKSVAKHMGDRDRIKYYAQELKENTYNLTRMNLVMRGIIPSNIMARNGDTLEDDWPYFDDNDPIATYDPLYVDAVVSNPPYSQNWTPTDREADPRYKSYGLAPKGKADYAFLLHDLYHLKHDGIMTIVLPHGVLFRGGEEGVIRKNLIESNNIDAIIGLPANIFFGTGIPTIIMVLKKRRPNTDVLIVDASKGFEKVGKNNRLRASDIRRVVDAVTGRKTIDKFSRLVTREEIRQNEYNLNIPRYVDSSPKAESWDIYASMFGGIPAGEAAELATYWQAFPNLKQSIFDNSEAEYLHIAVENLKETVHTHPDIEGFAAAFWEAFAGFHEYLYTELIEKMDEMVIPNEENQLTADIFRRLSSLPLIDPYQAYQILDDHWQQIATDLEILQTEGFDSVRRVDPRMMLKKKSSGEESEVQEGWMGRVLPFELVQKALLADELEEIRKLESTLSDIVAEYDVLLEELPEDEKEKAFVNEEQRAFVPAEVKKALKAKAEEPAVLELLKRFDTLNTREKAVKKALKEKTASLELLTKTAIEKLTDEQAKELLAKKWITPVLDGLYAMPEAIVSELLAKLEALSQKYATTFENVESEIAKTEKELCGMMKELTGSEYDLAGLVELRKLLGGE